MKTTLPDAVNSANVVLQQYHIHLLFNGDLFLPGAETTGGAGAHDGPCMTVSGGKASVRKRRLKEGRKEDRLDEARGVWVQTRPVTCASVPEDQISRRNTLRRERAEAFREITSTRILRRDGGSRGNLPTGSPDPFAIRRSRSKLPLWPEGGVR